MIVTSTLNCLIGKPRKRRDTLGRTIGAPQRKFRGMRHPACRASPANRDVRYSETSVNVDGSMSYCPGPTMSFEKAQIKLLSGPQMTTR